MFDLFLIKHKNCLITFFLVHFQLLPAGNDSCQIYVFSNNRWHRFKVEILKTHLNRNSCLLFGKRWKRLRLVVRLSAAPLFFFLKDVHTSGRMTHKHTQGNTPEYFYCKHSSKWVNTIMGCIFLIVTLQTFSSSHTASLPCATLDFGELVYYLYSSIVTEGYAVNIGAAAGKSDCIIWPSLHLEKHHL